MTSQETARTLNISLRTLGRLIERGRLTPVTQLPGRTGALLFDADEVSALRATLAPEAPSAKAVS